MVRVLFYTPLKIDNKSFELIFSDLCNAIKSESSHNISNTFFKIKICKFRLRFHWGLFPRIQLTIFRYWFRYYGLSTAGWQAIIRTNDGLSLWRIYASVGLNNAYTPVILILFISGLTLIRAHTSGGSNFNKIAVYIILGYLSLRLKISFNSCNQ